MNRRHFITVSGLAGVAAVTTKVAAAESTSGREYYELCQIAVENSEQRKGLDAFLKGALLPAANRIGLNPVGVFYPAEGLSPVYFLLRHKTIESFASWMNDLASDSEFYSNGGEFINAPASAPAFKRMESSLMVAFSGMPHIETPVRSPGRVFQLRTYESPGHRAGLKKIEMFNDAGEIKIFREVGLNPVFFGQTLVGTKMPNLTYMLAFKSMDEQQAAWKRFGAHPEWKRLSKMPEYADKEILCGITNLSLIPAEYSQI